MATVNETIDSLDKIIEEKLKNLSHVEARTVVRHLLITLGEEHIKLSEIIDGE